jgi:rfaE bifunctional protein nucleotidyltransferase chain/domain
MKKIGVKILLQKLKNSLRSKRIVMTNGCFDIIHSGHIEYLRKSKKYGDVLIVAINSDASVKLNKGRKRPIINLRDRIIILSELRSVDYIITFNSKTPKNLYKIIKPNIITKGQDYFKKKIAGLDHVLNNGGKLRLIALKKNQSTTKIINKIKKLN